MSESEPSRSESIFDSAEWYDLGINWNARLRRELPLLREVLGPPGSLGVLDAGCGPGHHAIALAQAGYRVTGLDAEADMLRVAAQHAAVANVALEWVESPYEDIPRNVKRPFDALYCLGNSLAAAGTEERARRAVHNFTAVVRPGGRMLLHVLNFDRMRREQPCVRGPRVCVHEGSEYVSTRAYHFESDEVTITSQTLWKDKTWQLRAHAARLYAVSPARLASWLADAGMRIDAVYGDYQRSPFDPDRSEDHIVVATRI